MLGGGITNASLLVKRLLVLGPLRNMTNLSGAKESTVLSVTNSFILKRPGLLTISPAPIVAVAV